MADDACAVDAEQRGPAVFVIVRPLFEVPNSRLEHQVSDPSCRDIRDLPLEHLQDRLGQTFADLERNVAGKPIADNNVRSAGKDILAFDIADEIDAGLSDELECLFCEFVAFYILLADAQEADLWILPS